MTTCRLLLLLLISAGWSSCSGPANPKPLKVNSTESLLKMELHGLAGENVDLKAIHEGKTAVFYFLSPECPLCQSYAPEIRRLAENYPGQDFLFFGVFPGKRYRVTEIDSFLKEYKPGIVPVLDPELSLTHLMGATVTPEVCVWNRQSGLLYKGRIDNLAYETGQKRIAATTHELEDVLAALHAEKNLSNMETEAFGCLIEPEK